jgi:hypothetical protein
MIGVVPDYIILKTLQNTKISSKKRESNETRN